VSLLAIDLGDLEIGRGGHLLVKRALDGAGLGERIEVRGRAPTLALDLRAWCRAARHRLIADTSAPGGSLYVVRERDDRFASALPAGDADASRPGAVCDEPRASWGLAARGARVEPGSPEYAFPLSKKSDVWADEAARLYAQAAAAQWDPALAIDWSAKPALPTEIEAAVVQVMTYLIENETAALVVPARFLGQIHPHFREVMQLLAIQAADEARHIEVFTRRALLVTGELGVSSAGGQASLKTLVDEPDFALSSFLLGVMGEGSFLSLLWFLRDHAPDATTANVARLTAQDEARHVAFGLAHLKRHVELDATLRSRLALAVERRHRVLTGAGGLNPEVFDALVLLAAGSWEPAAIAGGFERVHALVVAMDDGRKQRLRRLGFTAGESEALSAQHTLNFM
jgi:hypothetical protein